MNKILVLLFVSFLAVSQTCFSQKKGFVNQDDLRVGFNKDSIDSDEITVNLSGKTNYKDYKIFTLKGDTTYVDTILHITKEYKFNFLRKDNFELLAFHNQGQTFNNLGYSFNNVSRLPDIGFRAKQFSYLEVDEVPYYEVPTPTTEILYRTGLEQGQVLDALFTLNFSKRLNVSLAYKGLRSLGKYRRSLASHGNFRSSFNYRTPKEQYTIKGHVTSQDFTNQESGGLTPKSLIDFINDDPNFSTNRGRLDVNLENAENVFEGSRVFFEHDFQLLSTKDSVSDKNFTNLKVGHQFMAENKSYQFTQSSPTTAFFGKTSVKTINDKVKNKLTNNQLFLEFNSKYVLGKFKAKANYATYNYGYDSILNTSSTIDRLRLRGKAISFGGSWKATINNFQLIADAMITPGSGRLAGNHFTAEATYKKDSIFKAKATLLINSKSPNFNFLYYQSGYNKYNWQNTFDNINTQDIGFSLQSKWINASANFTNIANYTYFDVDSLPKQTAQNITYLKVKANKEFRYKKFALNNTLMYQNVSGGSAIFRVPEFVTRNTLYYQDYWFKGKPLLAQIGITFKYFTQYKANAYNPLLGEFIIQNTTKIGYPTVDVFFNAQVRRTRIYFKIDNVTSKFSKKNYFSAPSYPYRDFVIRFGVVWNWFI